MMSRTRRGRRFFGSVRADLFVPYEFVMRLPRSGEQLPSPNRSLYTNHGIPWPCQRKHSSKAMEAHSHSSPFERSGCFQSLRTRRRSSNRQRPPIREVPNLHRSPRMDIPDIPYKPLDCRQLALEAVSLPEPRMAIPSRPNACNLEWRYPLARLTARQCPSRTQSSW